MKFYASIRRLDALDRDNEHAHVNKIQRLTHTRSYRFKSYHVTTYVSINREHESKHKCHLYANQHLETADMSVHFHHVDNLSCDRIYTVSAVTFEHVWTFIFFAVMQML